MPGTGFPLPFLIGRALPLSARRNGRRPLSIAAGSLMIDAFRSAPPPDALRYMRCSRFERAGCRRPAVGVLPAPDADARGPTSPRRPRRGPARARLDLDRSPARRRPDRLLPQGIRASTRRSIGAKLIGSCDNRMIDLSEWRAGRRGKGVADPDVRRRDPSRSSAGGTSWRSRRRTRAAPPASSLRLVFEMGRQPVAPVVTDGSLAHVGDPVPGLAVGRL